MPYFTEYWVSTGGELVGKFASREFAEKVLSEEDIRIGRELGVTIDRASIKHKGYLGELYQSERIPEINEMQGFAVSEESWINDKEEEDAANYLRQQQENQA